MTAALPMGAAPGARARIGHALLRLVTGAVLLIAALYGCGQLLVHLGTSWAQRDGRVDRWLSRHRGQLLNSLTHYGTLAAETVTVIALGVLLFLALRLLSHRWLPSLFLAAAVLGEVTIFLVVTLLVDRPRPAVPRLDSAPPTSSFPSGHTAAAMTLYGSVAILVWFLTGRRWARTLAVIVAALVPLVVAFCRLYRGMHYPTDVTGGALLGLCWLSICYLVLLRPDVRSSSSRPADAPARHG